MTTVGEIVSLALPILVFNWHLNIIHCTVFYLDLFKV